MALTTHCTQPWPLQFGVATGVPLLLPRPHRPVRMSVDGLDEGMATPVNRRATCLSTSCSWRVGGDRWWVGFMVGGLVGGDSWLVGWL